MSRKYMRALYLHIHGLSPLIPNPNLSSTLHKLHLLCAIFVRSSRLNSVYYAPSSTDNKTIAPATDSA